MSWERRGRREQRGSLTKTANAIRMHANNEMNDPRLSKVVTRAAAAASLVLLFLACPRLPEWQTRITVPLLSRTFFASEVLDSSLFRVGPDSVLQLHVERTLDTVRAGDRFVTIGIHEAADFTVGDFRYAGLLDTVCGVSVDEMLRIGGPDSVLQPIPSFGCEQPLAVRLGLFDSAELAGGYLVANVDNRSAVRIDTVRVDLDGIDALVIGPVEPWSSAEGRIGLAGKTLDSPLLGSLRLTGPGSGNDSVWVHVRDSIFVRLTVDSLRLGRGRIVISDTGQARASLRQTSFIRTDQPIRFDSVCFAAGVIGCTLTNSLPVPLTVRVGMEEVEFDSTVTLGPSQDSVFSIDLTDRWYRNSSLDSNQLTVSVLVGMTPTVGPVDVDSAQGLAVRLEGEIRTLKYVAGTIHDTAWSAYRTDSLLTHLPPLVGGLKLNNLWLSCAVANGSNFASVMDFRLAAYSPAGESAVAETSVTVPPGTEEKPESCFATVDVARLFNVVPDRLYISRRGGATGKGSAGPNSFVASNVELEAPLRGALQPETFQFGPWTVRLDSILKSISLNWLDVDSVAVTVHVVNHLPVVPTGQLLLWAEPEETVAVNLAVPSAQIDPATGRVIAAGDSLVTIGLNENEVQVFRNPSLAAKLRLYFPATDTIALMSRDYFQVEYSYANLTVRVARK